MAEVLTGDSTTGEPDGPVGTEDQSIDRDEAFHVLRNQRRRFALHALKQRDEAVELGDLAEQVAAWEYDVEPDGLTAQQRKRVYNSLLQTHVPELEETGLVEYDRGTTELTDRAEEIDVYLEVVSGRDVPWSSYYLALSAVCSALLAAVWLGAPVVGAISDIGVAMFTAVTFGVSAVAHVAVQRETRIGEAEEPPELRGE